MTSRRHHLAAVLVSTAGVALAAVAAASWNPGVDARVVAADLVVGLVFIGSGSAVLVAGRARLTGLLLAAVGLAWFAGSIWPSLEYLHRGPLLHLLAMYPTGRFVLRSVPANRAHMVAVLAAYVANVTRLGGDPTISTTYSLVLVALAASGVIGARGALRRARLAGTTSAAAVAAVILAGSAARLVGDPLGPLGLYAYELVLAVVGLVLGVDLLRRAWAQAAVTQAVVDLGDASSGATVRERLAHSLGDPSLILGYAVEGRPGSFVDELGRPIAVPPASRDHAAVSLVLAGHEYGFVAGERALLDDPRLVESLSAAASLARSNSALQTEIRTRVLEVAASRERLVHAADAERRRLERHLRQGAIRRVAGAAAVIQLLDAPYSDAQASCFRLREELNLAERELADFARGVHPASLTDAGLATALADLAARTPVTTRLTVAADVGDPVAAATVYFVCSEAVANAVKHADARTLSIDVREGQGVLRVAVSDDGRGGAHLLPRGGLAGLADRVEALGGTLDVVSEPGAGSTVTMTLQAAERPPHPERATLIGASPAVVP